MPNWKKVVVSGSNAELNSLVISGVVNAGVDTDKFLVLDASNNVDFRTGANVLSDIGGASSSTLTTISSSFSTRITTLETQVITPVQTYVDFKSLTQGGLPWGGTTDLMPIDRWMGVWIAPSDGYLERVVVMVGDTNTATDDFSITVYKNGSQLSSTVVQTQGAVRTTTEFSFGSSYSYSKRDKITFYMSKAGNTSDLYTFNAYFYVQQ